MRRFVEFSRLVALGVTLGLGAVGCSDHDFLRGSKCDNDRQCGRIIDCENGVCGGCPDGLSDAGACLCPGERIFECRKIETSPRCVAVCPAADDLCAVAVVPPNGPAEQIPRCEGEEDERCFTLMADSTECAAGQMSIQVRNVSSEAPIVVNCPPPASEDSDFDCGPEQAPRSEPVAQ